MGEVIDFRDQDLSWLGRINSSDLSSDEKLLADYIFYSCPSELAGLVWAYEIDFTDVRIDLDMYVDDINKALNGLIDNGFLLSYTCEEGIEKYVPAANGVEMFCGDIFSE